MKKNNKKGFTLAELLIVVAIIAVLTAIAIPVFTSQLERSREATDQANVRSAYATVVANYLGDPKGSVPTAINVNAQQTVTGWQNSDLGFVEFINNSGASMYSFTAQTGAYAVGISVDSAGNVTPSITAGTSTASS